MLQKHEFVGNYSVISTSCHPNASKIWAETACFWHVKNASFAWPKNTRCNNTEAHNILMREEKAATGAIRLLKSVLLTGKTLAVLR